MAATVRLDFVLDDTPKSMTALLRRLGGVWRPTKTFEST